MQEAPKRRLTDNDLMRLFNEVGGGVMGPGLISIELAAAKGVDEAIVWLKERGLPEGVEKRQEWWLNNWRNIHGQLQMIGTFSK